MTAATARGIGGVVILAAGRARRFGSDKRTHVLADGRAMLTHSIELYGSNFPLCVVVLRPDDPDPEPAGQPRITPRIVRAADADLGMGHSLAAGARAATDWAYLFVALADMPWVTPATLARLRAGMERALAAHPAGIILQPLCGGIPGHPVGFSAGYLPELGELTGDEGARSMLRRHRQQVVQMELGDPGVLRDLDAPDQA